MASKLCLLALAAQAIVGHQLMPRDRSSNDPYPFCNPATNSNCVAGGRYLVPELDFSLENDLGDQAFNHYLPPTSYKINSVTTGYLFQPCAYWAVTADHWNSYDFSTYSITYADCSVPYTFCVHKKSSKSIDELATVVGRIPIGIRQATSVYLVYSDKNEDNPQYGGYIAAYAPHGAVIGRSSAYFLTSLIHEVGHNVDSNLASPDAPRPGSGSAFSGTSTWHQAIESDGYAVSAYGAGSATEDFPEAGRALLLDNIFPGGLRRWSGNNPNLTQITNQLRVLKSVAGDFYKTGGTCDLSRKFPPTSFCIGC